jgi:RNA polymerase sigma factor (sigma-70 family)
MRLTALSDYQLIKLYINGNERALGEVIIRHKDRLYTYLILLLKDRQLADDCFQDTIVKVIDTIRAGKYNDEGKFKPWMMQIAHNIVIDHFRKQQKIRIQHSTDEFDVFSVIGNGDLSVEDKMVEEQIHNDLRRLVAMLPEDKREIVLMRIYAKMPFKEIAWVTNCKLSTTIGRMRVALSLLRGLMEEHNVKLVA